MSTTQTNIVNAALIQIGADRVSSITEDVRRAVLINAIWDQSRDAVLRAHKWNFAVKRVEISPNSTTPEWGYDYEYDLPTDCLKVLETDPDDIEFNIESDAAGNARILRTDETTLDILYIWRNTNESMWDSNFADAFSAYLSWKVAYALTQSLALQDSWEKKYKSLIVEARSVDGAEGTLKGLESSTWTDSRRGRRGFNGKV